MKGRRDAVDVRFKRPMQELRDIVPLRTAAADR